MPAARTTDTSVFGRKDTHPEHAVKTDPAQTALLKALDAQLRGTFPASDPPSVSQPTTAGSQAQRKACPRATPTRR